MKCLHIISGDLWAGAEVSAFHTIRELAERQEVRAIVLNDGPLSRSLSAAGTPTTVLSEISLGFPRVALQGLREVRRWRPHIIHSHRYKEDALGAILAAACGAVHVRTVHGLTRERSSISRYVACLVGDALDDWMGSSWIAVSEDLARQLRGRHRRVVVVPNGIPQEAPVPGGFDFETLFCRPDGLYVGFVGRLESVKRPDRFLRVLSRVPQFICGREVRGVIVGEGGLAAEVQRLADTLGLGDRVRCLGHRNDSETIVSSLDLLVIPSDHEGLPMVLLEAMRSAIPIVASAVGGIRDVLGDEPWLLEPTDEQGMAAAATDMLSHGQRRIEWARRLRSLFLQEFTIDRVACEVSRVYERALAREAP